MDWGKRIALKFDKDLFNVTSILTTKFRLKEIIYGTYIYPIAVTYGLSHNELYLEFKDFNNANEPLLLEYIGTELMGLDLEVGPFETYPEIQGLVKKGIFEHLEVGSITATGDIKVPFDGKGYVPTEYLEVASITATGGSYLLLFKTGYISTEHLEMVSITATGIYCDVNGVPI